MRQSMLISLASVVCLCAAAHAEPGGISIGISAPLTGEAATYGTDIKNSIEFANQQIAGGKYRLIAEDDKCSGKDAATVAHKLTEIDKVSGVLGFGCSGALLAAAPIYERAKTVVIDAGGSAPAISQAGDYIFRTVPSDTISASVLYAYTSSRHRTFGVLAEETDYAQALASAFAAQNTGKKLALVRESYLAGTSDFRSLIVRLRGKKIDGLFVITQAEQTLAVIVRQIREQSWTVPLYAIYWPSSPAFLSALGLQADGIVYADIPGNEVLTEEGRKVFDGFVSRYGLPKSSDYFFYLSYAAFAALHQALESGADLRDALAKGKFESVFGPFSFDENGDVVGLAHVLKVIKNGKPQLLK